MGHVFFFFFFSSAVVLGSRKRLKIVSKVLCYLKAFLILSLGPWGGREVRSSGNVAHPLVQLPLARPGWRAELRMAMQGRRSRNRERIPWMGTPFRSYLCFRQHLISSPIWAILPGLVYLGKTLAFLCRAEERNSEHLLSTGPQ